MKRHICYILVSFAVVALSSCGGEKTAYINMGEIYQGFELSKQLDADYQEVASKRKAVLDSLQIRLNVLSQNFQAQKDEASIQRFQQQKQTYYYKEQQFKQDNQALLQQHNEQITKQLNQYIKEFGDEQGYTYIYGASGNGSLMYAAEKEDITQEVIAYINQKYQGLK